MDIYNKPKADTNLRLYPVPDLYETPELGPIGTHPSAPTVGAPAQLPDLTKGQTLLTEYRIHLAATRSHGTVTQRLGHIEALRFAHRDLLIVTESDLELQLSRMRAQGLAAETRKSVRASYRSFYQWAHRKGYIAYDPTDELEPVRIPITVPRIAPDDIVQLSLLTATEEQRTMILLARLACLRLTELTTLRLDARQHDSLRIRGKGDKVRTVYINDDLMQVLLERERAVCSGFYFPGRWGGSMHPQSVNKIITRVTGCNPHSLRHAGATAAYRSTRDLRAIQQMLGHASMATTQRYLHLDEDALRAAAAGTAFTATIHSPHFPQALSHAA